MVGERGGIATPEMMAEFRNMSPEVSDYALIGHIALNLTALEYQIESLIWYYMEDVDKGHIATARMGSISKTEMLATLVEWIEPDDGIADAIAWASQCFHVLRESRNSIIHGYNFKADRRAGTLSIERRTKSLVFDSFLLYEINREVLAQVKRDQEILAMYMWKLDRALRQRPQKVLGPNRPPPAKPAQLPDKPALPSSLSPLPHETPKSARRQRAELAEKEAQLEKTARLEQRRAKDRLRREVRKNLKK